MPKTKTIYAIRDQKTHEVKYIGQSINPENRYWQHLAQVKNNKDLARWMAKSIKDNNTPEIIELETVREKDAGKREAYYISKHLETIFNLVKYSPTEQTPTQKLLSIILPALEFREPKTGELDFYNPFADKPIFKELQENYQFNNN